MSDGAVIGTIVAGVAGILTAVFTFLLRWRSQRSAESDPPKPSLSQADPLAVERGLILPTYRSPGDTGRHAALLDSLTGTGRHAALSDGLSSVDWVALQRHVAAVAAQQPVTNKEFVEGLGAVKQSVQEVQDNVARVEKKLDRHIADNGKRHDDVASP